MDADPTNPKGLIFCNFSNNPDSYCWLKLCEILISIGFLLASLYEMLMQIKIYGWRIQWRFFALLFMILSLIINIFYCLWNQIYVLYSLQSYFFSLYFLTIVGYVCRLYMRKNNWDSQPYLTKIFIIAIVLIGAMYTTICIDSIVNQSKQAMINQSCEEIWYLCVNVACLALCMVALVVLFVNYREETQKMLTLSYSTEQVHNPLKSLWFWIGINTFSQIVDLIESGLLIGTDRNENNCMVIKGDQVANNILFFIFNIIAFTAGFAATLVYFAHVRKSCAFIEQISLKTSVDVSEDMRGSYGVEMFNTFLQNFTG